MHIDYMCISRQSAQKRAITTTPLEMRSIAGEQATTVQELPHLSQHHIKLGTYHWQNTAACSDVLWSLGITDLASPTPPRLIFLTRYLPVIVLSLLLEHKDLHPHLSDGWKFPCLGQLDGRKSRACLGLYLYIVIYSVWRYHCCLDQILCFLVLVIHHKSCIRIVLIFPRPGSG